MAIRHILVPLAGTDDETHVVVGALNLARRLDAHVAVTTTMPSRATSYVVGGFPLWQAYGDEVAAAITDQRIQARAAARKSFDTAVKDVALSIVNHPPCSVPSAWFEPTAVEDGIAAITDRVTDLVVVGRPRGAARVRQHELVAEALFDLRRPVLMLPFKSDALAGSVAVAWNGSVESANALAAGIALFRAGVEVTVICVGDQKGFAMPVERAVEYLGWHGFPAKVKAVADQPHATANILRQEAHTAGACLLVMGGYGHSRARETIFGGVTATFLERADLPVLMAH